MGLGKTDIRFDDPRLNRLMLHINRLTEELELIQQMLASGGEGEVLIKRSNRDYDAGWGSGGGGGSAGEANTAQNVGNGAGIFRDKSGVTLNLRGLLNGSGISIEVVGDDIRISATSSAEELEPILIAGAFA